MHTITTTTLVPSSENTVLKYESLGWCIINIFLWSEETRSGSFPPCDVHINIIPRVIQLLYGRHCGMKVSVTTTGPSVTARLWRLVEREKQNLMWARRNEEHIQKIKYFIHCTYITETGSGESAKITIMNNNNEKN